MITPTYGDVVSAATRIAPFVHRTPVFTNAHLDELVGGDIFLKAENLQKVGAFKARGATNAVLSLSDVEVARGVVTHSSGNHGQAVAYAAAIRGIPATVVMPHHAPKVKVEAVSGYGAEIVFCSQDERETTLQTLQERTGAVIVHPFDDPAVIAGQGTATLELVEQAPDLDVIVAPIGGGGLLSGASLVGEHEHIDVIGAEPEAVDDSYRSLRDGVRYPATGAISVGDGLLTGLGELAFRILSAASRRILLVSDEEMLSAMRLMAVRTKLLIEPSSATAIAAIIRYREEFSGRRTGLLISGGNVELGRLSDSGDRR
ncbi:MAG: pyridoxal-phosphate dependent enzyme [Acidimicrobiia bacterium]|nr:MAG: pyridoxal-phosphate dependent enzyme [Acidimicrobiia bacterium]